MFGKLAYDIVYYRWAILNDMLNLLIYNNSLAMSKRDQTSIYRRSSVKPHIEILDLQRITKNTASKREPNSFLRKTIQKSIKPQNTQKFKQNLVSKVTPKPKKSINLLDHFQAILNSRVYQALSEKYGRIKVEQNETSKKLKAEIVSLNHDLTKRQKDLTTLQNLKHSLTAECDYLLEAHHNIQLRNYDLRCQLYAVRGYGQGEGYDSLRAMEWDEEWDYEEMLQLEERVGKVDVGYNESILNAIPDEKYTNKNEGQFQHCCICCEPFVSDDSVFTTECLHIHHRQCIKKWLKLKRQCPLCRQEIVLTNHERSDSN